MKISERIKLKNYTYFRLTCSIIFIAYPS